VVDVDIGEIRHRLDEERRSPDGICRIDLLAPVVRDLDPEVTGKTEDLPLAFIRIDLHEHHDVRTLSFEHTEVLGIFEVRS
jgi:hypothetical protein